MPEKLDSFYITTSIAYPNANPHIGYAMELAQADFFARYYRLNGHPVRFLTGVDVHGQKIQETAEKGGLTPAEFVANKTVIFQKLAQDLTLSHDRFITTRDEDHMKMAQAMWRACEARGDIYKKRYQAWYNTKEEEFLGMVDEHPDSAEFGIDPQFIQKIDEENYFFRLSRYKDEVVTLLSDKSILIHPASRAQELLNFVSERGLEDVSISREKSKLSWGVPVPGDDTQVMYVWFDALTNYLSHSCTIDDRGIIIPGEFWPANMHCIGKDIQRFHALLWPGMLLSAGLPLPKEILVHGFITVDGRKMSKSLGNVVDPFLYLDKYGTDAVRWYLLKEISTTGDGDFGEARFSELYTADLANDLGNLVSRVWTMAQKYIEGRVPMVTAEQIANAEQAVVEGAWKNYQVAVEERNIQKAIQVAHGLTVFCNRRIEELKPWVMAKDEFRRTELEEFLYELLESVRQVVLMLSPVLPNTAKTVAAKVFPEMPTALWEDFMAGSQWGGLTSGSVLGTEQCILFPRVEV